MVHPVNYLLIHLFLYLISSFVAPLTSLNIKSYSDTTTSHLIDIFDSTLTPISLAINYSPLSGALTVSFSNQIGGNANGINWNFFYLMFFFFKSGNNYC